jgi:ferrous iron transport protein A
MGTILIYNCRMEMTHNTELPRSTPMSVASATAARAPTVPTAGAAAGAVRLADLATGAAARVVSVSATDTASADSGASAGLSRRLAELGFLPGERLRIVARGFLGREPIAVRIGTGTFALRLFEAACIRVCPEQPLLR